MSFADRNNYSEDLFADTRMTFGEHLEDLRTHLWRAIAGFLVAMVISFIPGWTVLQFIAKPVEDAVRDFYDRRIERVDAKLREGTDAKVNTLNESKEQEVEVNVGELAKERGFPLPAGISDDGWVKIKMRLQPVSFAVALAKAQQEVGHRPGLSTLGPMEAFMAYIKVCVVCGLVLGSPWIFWQIWAFVAAGLYPHEKRLVNVYLPISVALFLAGAILCQFLVIPKALEALLWFNYWLNLEPDLRFNEWLSFAILLPVLFGISFQLPMLMMFLERVGIMTVAVYKKKWRIAFFLIHAFAAVVTPIDIFSMESLALTMCALYALGIGLCWFNPRRRERDLEVPNPEESVEV
jgi:sec-independent protein translocase protein TatC